MSTTMITAIGFAAAALTTLAFLPQAVKSWRSRSTSDVSLGMALLLVIGIVLWLAWHVWQLKHENATYDEILRKYGDSETVKSSIDDNH